jgi:antitoxin component YwqK of YwqJK toxin-antitoxin module
MKKQISLKLKELLLNLNGMIKNKGLVLTNPLFSLTKLEFRNQIKNEENPKIHKSRTIKTLYFMKNLYKLNGILFIVAILFGCSSTLEKTPLKKLSTNQKGYLYKIGDNKDTILFTGIAVDSNNIEDGKKYIIEEECLNGELNGLMTKYYLNGKIYFTLKFKNGKRNGNEVSYYENGQKSGEGSYSNDEMDGKWIWYKENGNIDFEKEYKNGSYEKKCDCCSKMFWSNEGWASKPRGLGKSWYAIYPKQENDAQYCSKKCALDCE